MNRRGHKKIKDLVEMLEDPDNSGYIGGDYEDMMDMMDDELAELEEDELQEEIE